HASPGCSRRAVLASSRRGEAYPGRHDRAADLRVAELKTRGRGRAYAVASNARSPRGSGRGLIFRPPIGFGWRRGLLPSSIRDDNEDNEHPARTDERIRSAVGARRDAAERRSRERHEAPPEQKPGKAQDETQSPKERLSWWSIPRRRPVATAAV